VEPSRAGRSHPFLAPSRQKGYRERLLWGSRAGAGDETTVWEGSAWSRSWGRSWSPPKEALCFLTRTQERLPYSSRTILLSLQAKEGLIFFHTQGGGASLPAAPAPRGARRGGFIGVRSMPEVHWLPLRRPTVTDYLSAARRRELVGDPKLHRRRLVVSSVAQRRSSAAPSAISLPVLCSLSLSPAKLQSFASRWDESVAQGVRFGGRRRVVRAGGQRCAVPAAWCRVPCRGAAGVRGAEESIRG
jgi:hypothetical protein